MCLPRIVFSAWHSWPDRLNIPNSKTLPGLYLLAHLSKSPKGSANPISQDIIYVGETHGQTLVQRWAQFDRCAFYGAKGHAGGMTYAKKYPPATVSLLYVSACPVANLPKDKKSLVRTLFILHIERKLILQYGMKYIRLPNCNSH